MRIIDSHCLFGRWPREPRDVSLPTLLKILSQLGIDKGVCVSLRGVFLDHEEGNAENTQGLRGPPATRAGRAVRPEPP
jgi:hypothetical protein